MFRELVENGGTNHSNVIVDVGMIKREPSETPRFCSLFSFDHAMVDHVRVTGSVAGFKGIAYCDAVWFDIDNKHNQGAAHADCIRLIEHLNQKYGLSPDDLFIYFSGNKGFHIAILHQLFGGIEGATDIHERIRKLVSIIKNDVVIDTTIYDKVRIFRMEHSRHAESKLYKIQLSFEELKKLSLDEIRKLAEKPRLDFVRDKLVQPIKNKLLSIEWQNIQNETKVGRVSGQHSQQLWEIPKEGNRDNLIFSQACKVFEHSDLSKESVLFFMRAVNNLVEPPLSDGEVIRKVESAFNTITGDKKKYKDEADLIIKPFSGWMDEYIDYVFHPTSTMTCGFPSFNNALKKRIKGKLCCVVGYGGSKKSLFALNTCLTNIQDYGCHAIYSTMEMSANNLIDRVVDYLVKIEDKYINASDSIQRATRNDAESFLKEKVSPLLGDKLYITQNSSLTCKHYDKLIERTINQTGRLDMLVVDGLSMMGGDGKETERYSDNTRELKELANKWNIYVQLICHVSKGGDKHTRDLTHLIRGSEKIFDNCDFIITFSQLIDMLRTSDGITEYLTDKGYARLYDKRGSGITMNKIFEFNPYQLRLTETSYDPMSFEATGRQKGGVDF